MKRATERGEKERNEAQLIPMCAFLPSFSLTVYSIKIHSSFRIVIKNKSNTPLFSELLLTEIQDAASSDFRLQGEKLNQYNASVSACVAD